MKIALCQFNVEWENKQANKEKIRSMMEACPQKEGIDWIVFPEMTLSGFSMNTEKTSLSPEDISFFSEFARKYSTWVSFGGVEGGFNNLITINNAGEIVSAYSKIYLYSFGGENKKYKAGEKQTSFTLEDMTVVPAVCFDLRFPQLFWDVAEKTDLFVIIACWPAGRSMHWMNLLRTRAIENQYYVIGVNRTGKEPDIEYSGNSMIYDPLGKVVLDCGEKDGVFVSEIDVNKAFVTKTRTKFPFFKDRKK